MVSRLLVLLAIVGLVSSQSVRIQLKAFRERVQLFAGLSRDADCVCEERHCHCLANGHPSLGYIDATLHDEGSQVELEMKTHSSAPVRQLISVEIPELTECFDVVPDKYGFCVTLFNIQGVIPVLSLCSIFSLTIGGVSMDIPVKFCFPIPFVGIPIIKAPK